MANDPQTRTNFRRAIGIEKRRALLGDSAGVIYEPGRSGYVRVRYPTADGYGFPTVVKLGIATDLEPGLAVVVRHKDGEPTVTDIDIEGVIQSGGNGYSGQVVNQQTNAPDLNLSPILLSSAFGAALPLYVKLYPFKYIRNGTVTTFSGVIGGVNLSSYIPAAADEWCAVGLFLKPDGTHEVVQSADQSTSDALGDDDFQECVVASTNGSIPVAFYKLTNGQASIADTDKLWDARQWINVPESDYATADTANNTQTTLASIAVAEASLVTITGVFSGVLDDYSAAIAGTFVASVRRATGGNATLVGVTVTSNEDSGGSPSFTVDADTGTQTARLRVTGISAQDWQWSVRYETLVT